MEFQVTKLLNNDQVCANCLNHNKQDFNNLDKIYLDVNGVVYPSQSSINILQKHIGLNTFIRSKMNLSLDDKVKIKQQSIDTNITLNELTLHIMVVKHKKILSIHEDILKEKILLHFKNYNFCHGQLLNFQHEDNWLNFTVELNTKKYGFLTKTSIINLISQDPALNIIGAKLLKRDLFRDDYNFEELGIGGLNKELITLFRRALSLRAIKSSTCEKLGIQHIRGLLLYGPPGCGKTLIARKIGSLISNIEPKVVNGPEILNKYVGQSEENIRNLFTDAKTDYELNKENASLHPIIFDEIDAICKSRKSTDTTGAYSGIVNMLLSIMDGVHQLNNIFIIAMTNRKDLLDEALLRPGRIEIHLSIGLPNKADRKQIFKIHTNKMRSNNLMDKNIDIDKLASLTENFTGAEIEGVVKNAGTRAVHECLTKNSNKSKDDNIMVTMNQFLESIKEIVPAFGNVEMITQELIPNEYTHKNKNHQNCYDKILDYLVSDKKQLKTILIIGAEKSGKTTLLAKIINDSKIKHSKMIRSIDTITMDETSKSNHISNIVMNAYISDHSIIGIDDLESVINYAEINNSTAFSNKMYQTITTLLKTNTNKSHKINIIITCGNDNLAKQMEKFFDLIFNIS